MAADKVKVFISSSMQELSTERRAVHAILMKDRIFEPFAWEADAGARPSSAQQAWREELAEAHVCIVILWHKIGQWTRDELATAMELELSLLVYVKVGDDGQPDPDVQAFLLELEDPATGGFISGRFDSPDRLKKLVTRDLARVLADTMSDKRDRDITNRSTITGSGRALAPAPAERGWVATEAPAPRSGRRPTDELGRLPRNRGQFVNRTDEAAKAVRAIEGDDRAVALTGAPGMGKKALLSHLTHKATFEGRFPDGAGVHPEQADCDDVEDVIQAIWEEFFVPSPLGQVEPRERLRQLRSIDALVFLLDLDLDAAQVDDLVDAVPNATFCFSYTGTGRPSAKAVRLPPLTDPDHLLELFESRYQADVPEVARADVLALCERAGGSPARVLLLADLAWTEAEDTGGPADATHPLTAWAAAHATLPAEDLVRMLVSPDAAAPVAIAAAVGVPVPHDVLAAVTSITGVDDGVADLVLQPGSPRYRLNPAVAELHPVPDDTTDLLAPVFAETASWVHAVTPERLYEDRAFVLRMLEWGNEQRRWADVLRIVRVVEPAVAIGGRWGAWRQVLQHGLTAARGQGDEHAEAWALHQLGARSLVDDDDAGARVLLHQALEKRDRLGDVDAAAVTRRTLSQVPLAVMSALVLAALVAAFVGWSVLLFGPRPGWQKLEHVVAVDIDPEIVRVGQPATVTVRNAGTSTVTISFDPASAVTGGSCLGAPLVSGAECTIEVSATQLGTILVAVKDASTKADRTGDRQIVVVND